ncbi:1-aminocyclopropane-1-carboxylate deaminase/D-cysteine desulfhydrase [Microbulbifer agarilyticus]|uniref:1-aminocyclopropane-1-carboxylate deaminase/D-cysteine desulfhydrase n=1 Tax=Microbulbifer agarilyticus TaxID=260552 RepID=UPI001CD6EA40|nr:pyridoxal-phosphate dependent enzyme [Microbulbifer agarilyticus]MCA0901394.1 pyridoxal-phosphate dependent enzyme [Microbulbifer agarilyticus]
MTELSLDAFVDAAENVPYQQINSELFPNIDLWVRRDDLIDPIISGNKAYKLIYNLLEARKLGKDTIVTCGGAWSNHIHATAAAGQRFGFKTIGIIRGERPPVLGAMLQDAERFGMELRFVCRSDYRKCRELSLPASLGLKMEGSWFVPEGGANSLGASGVRLLGRVIRETSPVAFDQCWVACGTGLSLGALASGLPPTIKLFGVAVLKAEKSILAAVKEWGLAGSRPMRTTLIADGHQGGYGKVNDRLLAFQKELEQKAYLPIDHVYTAKVIYALMRRCTQLKQGRHSKRQWKVLLVHTGGLQGRRGIV